MECFLDKMGTIGSFDEDESQQILGIESDIYFHDMANKNFDKESFTFYKTISTIKEFWDVYQNLSNPLQVMMFVMRKGKTPLATEPYNKNGGYWSFRIPMYESKNPWIDLSMAFTGNTLVYDMKDIIGISYSPKSKFSLLKIWCRDQTKKELIESVNTGSPLLKNEDARWSTFQS